MKPADFLWLAVFVPLVPLGVALSRRLFGHWFSPLSIFVGINSLSMAGYHLRLLDMPDAIVEVHFLLLAAFVAFLLGTLLVGGNRAVEPPRPADAPLDTTGLAGFFYVTVVLSTVGWLVQLVILTGRLGLATLIRNIWVLQSTFQMQFVGYLNLLGILVFPAFVLRRLTGTARRWDVLLALSALFGLLLAGIKGYMVFSVMGGVYVFSVVRPARFRMVHLAAGMGLILAFFVFYVARVDIFSQEHYRGTGIMAHLPALHMPYLYFVGSWPSLGFVVDGTVADLPRLGTFVLQPLWKILGLLGIIDFATLYQPFVNFGSFTFNVYSLVGEVYWDLGWPGVLGVTFLLGWITTAMYLRPRRCDYWGHVLVYAVLVHGLFISFFSFTYTFNVYVMLAYLYLAGFVAARGGALVVRPSGEAG